MQRERGCGRRNLEDDAAIYPDKFEGGHTKVKSEEGTVRKALTRN